MTAPIPDPIRIDTSAHQAWQGDKLVPLPPMAFRLLAYLMRNAGKAVTRQQIMREVWETAWMGSNTLDMHIWTLRRALGDDPANPTYIATVRGVGYRFEKQRTASVDASARVVEIDGRQYDILHWERLPDRDSTRVFTLYAREASSAR